jgi:hypothetical protein
MRTNNVACDLSITLVHGTWPRGALRDVLLTPFYGVWPSGFRPKQLWFAEDSDFRTRLTAALSTHGLSAQIAAFTWSGANSVRERDKAARQLAEHIRAKQSEYPTSAQVVIAHSHGGNVALRAVDQLEKSSGKVFLVTLATPFVEILRTMLSPKEIRQIDFMASLTTSILVPQYATQIRYSYFPTLDPNIFYVIVGLGSVLPFLLLSGLRARNTAEMDELVGLTALSPSIRKNPLLVLRAIDDEAALSFAAAAIGNRLSRLLQWLSYKIWVWLPISLVVFAVVLIAAPALMTQFLQPIFDFSFDWAPVFARGLILAFFAFLFLPGAFNSAYGRELFLIFQGCEINSQSTPDSIERRSEFQSMPTSWGSVVTLLKSEEAQGRLRHGLYDHPQCAEQLASWLKRQTPEAVPGGS